MVSPQFNYKILLLNWGGVFGESSIIVQNYREARSNLKFYLEREIRNLSKSERFYFHDDMLALNVSPSLFAYETLRIANSLFLSRVVMENQEYPFRPGEFFARERRVLVEKIKEIDVFNCKYRVNRQVWFDAFKEVNSWVELEFPGVGKISPPSPLPTLEGAEVERILRISEDFAHEYVSTTFNSTTRLDIEPYVQLGQE